MHKYISLFLSGISLMLCSNIALSQTTFSYVVVKKQNGVITTSANTITDKKTEFSYEPVDQIAFQYFFTDKTGDWNVFFAAPFNDGKLNQGIYSSAKSGGEYNYPGLGLGVNEKYCDNPNAEFTVKQIHSNLSNQIDKLAVDFVQRCPEIGRTVYGAFRYNSEIPLDLEEYIARQSIKLASLNTLSTTKKIVDLPYVQVGNTFKHLRFSIVTQAPLTLKLRTIKPSINHPIGTKNLAKLNANSSRLFIPELVITDGMNKKHVFKNVYFIKFDNELKIDSLFTKRPN